MNYSLACTEVGVEERKREREREGTRDRKVERERWRDRGRVEEAHGGGMEKVYSHLGR